MKTLPCGTLDIAFCKTNPELIRDDEPDESDEFTNRLILGYILIAIPSVSYTAYKLFEWVVDLALRVVN